MVQMMGGWEDLKQNGHPAEIRNCLDGGAKR